MASEFWIYKTKGVGTSS